MDRYERLHIHNHNRLIGHACMIRTQAMNLINAKSTTPEAKYLADQIAMLSHTLEAELRKRRVNLDETITILEPKQ